MRFLSSHVPSSGFSDGMHDLELSLPAQPPQAETSGELPVATVLWVGPIALGPGGSIVARDIDDKPERAALWATDADVTDAVATWAALAEQFPTTGLWPLLLHGLHDGSGRPWSNGELEPVSEAAVDALDGRAVLEEGWHGWLVPINNPWAPGTGPLAPFGPDFPGLAPERLPESDGPLGLSDGPARLGLVSCRRPADAVALAGWMGAINRTSTTEVSAVLRSWEDRFGATLIGLSFATMTLLVSRPPTTDDEALRVAVEVAALCPDSLWQPEALWPYEERDTTLVALSRQLRGEHVWRLWWD